MGIKEDLKVLDVAVDRILACESREVGLESQRVAGIGKILYVKYGIRDAKRRRADYMAVTGGKARKAPTAPDGYPKGVRTHDQDLEILERAQAKLESLDPPQAAREAQRTYAICNALRIKTRIAEDRILMEQIKVREHKARKQLAIIPVPSNSEFDVP